MSSVAMRLWNVSPIGATSKTACMPSVFQMSPKMFTQDLAGIFLFHFCLIKRWSRGGKFSAPTFGAPPLADPKFGRVISFVPQELPGLTKDLHRCSLEGFEAAGRFTRWRVFQRVGLLPVRGGVVNFSRPFQKVYFFFLRCADGCLVFETRSERDVVRLRGLAPLVITRHVYIHGLIPTSPMGQKSRFGR